MAITKLNSLAIPDDTIVEADLSYPLTGFSSTGIDDNATSTAITISSSQNVGIGTDPSPALGTGLHIRGSGYANLTLQKSASNVGHALEFTDENNAIQYRIGTNFASGGQNLLFAYGSTPAIGMMLDSSGNLLVGTAQHRPANNNVNGNSIDGTFGIESSVTSGGPLTLNRKSTDGGIASFKKDGTTIGVIGTKSSGLYIGTDDAGIFFNDHGGGDLDAIFPYDVGTNTFYNGHVDIGGSSNKFRNIHISGSLSTGDGVTFGSTGGSVTSKTLDDYEEGTHSASITPSSSGSVTLNGSYSTLKYVKIGNLVTVTGYMSVSSVSSPAGVFYISLPFYVASGAVNSAACELRVNNCVSANVSDFWAEAGGGTNSIQVYIGGSNTVSLTSAQQLKASTDIRVFVSYYTS